MDYTDFKQLLEKRAHADKNQKESLSGELMKVIDNNNIYLNFSDSPQIRIKISPQWSTPTGIYAWQLSYYKKRIKDIVNSDKKSAKRLYDELEEAGGPTFEFMDRHYPHLKQQIEGNFINIKHVFPFREGSAYVHVLEAKSGIKWLDLTGKSISQSEFLNHMDTNTNSN